MMRRRRQYIDRSAHHPSSGAAAFAFVDFRQPYRTGPFAAPYAPPGCAGKPNDRWILRAPFVPGFGLGQSAFTMQTPGMPGSGLLTRKQFDAMVASNAEPIPSVKLANLTKESGPNPPWWMKYLPKPKA